MNRAERYEIGIPGGSNAMRQEVELLRAEVIELEKIMAEEEVAK